jgi:hypothetical protein
MLGYEIGDSIYGHRIIDYAGRQAIPWSMVNSARHNHQSSASTLTLPMKRLSSTGAET